MSRSEEFNAGHGLGDHPAVPKGYRIEPAPDGSPRHLNAFSPRGAHVGYLSWFKGEGEDPPKTYKISVKPAHQRKGVATALFETARQQEPNLQHHNALSDEGRAWAESTSVTPPPKWVKHPDGHHGPETPEMTAARRAGYRKKKS